MKIAVIGGGIVGATTAFYLVKAGIDVTLFDEGIGQASTAAAGIISPWLSQRRNKNWYALAKEGAKFYPTFLKDIAAESTQNALYKQVGTLLFKNKPQLLEKLYRLALDRKNEAPEIGAITLLSPQEIQKKIPVVHTQESALFIGGGARVDGKALISHLITQFRTLGGQYQQEKVRSLQPQNNAWIIESTTSSPKAFDQIVLTTGAWLPSLLTPLHYEVDIRPQKGQLVELQTPLATHNWPVIMPQGKADIIPFNDGKLLIGATHENDLKFDLAPDVKKANGMLHDIAPLIPTIYDYQQADIRVGTRAFTSDFLPFFGAISHEETLLVASGLGSSGLTTGPIIGKMISDFILKKPSTLPMEHYTPAPYIKKTVT